MQLSGSHVFSGSLRSRIVLSAALLITSAAHGQPASLVLASGSAAQTGSVSLNLTLNPSSVSTPSALQWTIRYATSGILSLKMAAGPALKAAGKSLSCSSVAGSVSCVASGMNNAVINSGVVAVVTATLRATSGSKIPLPLSSVMGVSPD